MSLATTAAQRTTAEHVVTIDRLRAELERERSRREMAEKVAVVWHDRAVRAGWVPFVPAQRSVDAAVSS